MSRESKRIFSQAVEDYLKAIYVAQQHSNAASTSSLAQKLGASSPAVTKMIKHLAKLKLVNYTPYQGVNLTDAGEAVALEILRHHRLLELYLYQALGYGWDAVHAEAEKLEHHISEEFEARIEQILDYPSFDPHGSSIPRKDGTIAPERGRPLSKSNSGDMVKILRVADSDPEILVYLEMLGMNLETKIHVKSKQPFNGSLLLEVNGEDHTIGYEVAEQVFVEMLVLDSLGSRAIQ